MLYLRGRLLLTDNIILGKTAEPLPGRRITLATNNGDSVNFLYSDTTDAQGYFSFLLLESYKDSTFVLRFEDTIGGFKYIANGSGGKGADILLTASLNDSQHNGFVLTVNDENNENLPKATVRIYNNLQLATQNQPAGVVDSFITNQYGKGYKFDLPAGKYYLNTARAVDTILYQRLLKTIALNATGVQYDSVVMRKVQDVVPPAPVNGFELGIKDSLDGNISNATVYVFTSQVLAASNNEAGAYKIVAGDALGKAALYNIPAGTYYINASKQVDTIVYQRIMKPLAIPAAGIVSDTLVVRRK